MSQNVKIVLCGPPQSGKSCLREGLKSAISKIPGAPYCYVITACPDGEGSWYQATVNHDPKRAAECKEAYKGQFSPEFVKRVADSVKNCTLPLTLVDIGGIPDKKNEMICTAATHAILLSSDSCKFQEWRDFCYQVGLTIVAEIWSDYHGNSDSVQKDENALLIGSVHHLERGESVADRPMIQALARHLVETLGNL